MVGTSGSDGTRAAVATPRMRSLPSLTNCSAVMDGAKNMSTRPLITSVIAAGAPLYGICRVCTPAVTLNSSPLRCEELPLPAEL
ncbi:hypothetical protein D3C72_1582710 [compost metagenome]